MERLRRSGRPSNTRTGQLRRPKRALSRPPTLVTVLIVAVAAGAAGLTTTAGAATACGYATVPHLGVRSIPLTSGTSALYSSYLVTSASAGGAIVLIENRLGDAQPNFVSTAPLLLPAGTNTLENLHPAYPSSAYAGAGDVQISGSMIAYDEYDTTTGGSAIWWYDVATRKSGLSKVPIGKAFAAAAPSGYIYTSQGTSEPIDYDNVLSGNVTSLGNFDTFNVDGQIVAGPAGIVVPSTRVQYVTYSPVRTTTLVPASGSDTWQCESVIATAVGCLEYLPKTGTTDVYRIPLSGGAKIGDPAGTGEQPTVVVTPRVTAWEHCAATSCTLSRTPATGGTVTNIRTSVITEAPFGIGAIGDTFYWGQQYNATANGGLFDMTDSATAPTHLFAAPFSPRAVSNVSVSGSTVSWMDNGEPGLGVWSRSLSGSGPTLGTPRLDSQAGYVYNDSADYALGLSNSGGSIAHSSYERQPTSTPLSVWVKGGGAPSQISSLQSPASPQLTYSGASLLYTTLSGPYLDNVATHRKTALTTAKVRHYALGGGYLAWVASDGSVWEEKVGTETAREVRTALPAGDMVFQVQALAVDGQDVAWAYGWGSSKSGGNVAQYVLPSKSSSPITIPDAVFVNGLVVSASYLGVLDNRTGSTLYLISLSSAVPTEMTLTTNSYDLSISGDYATWIGIGSHMGFVGHI